MKKRLGMYSEFYIAAYLDIGIDVTDVCTSVVRARYEDLNIRGKGIGYIGSKRQFFLNSL